MESKQTSPGWAPDEDNEEPEGLLPLSPILHAYG